MHRFLLLASCLLPALASDNPAIPRAKVDPRVELVATVFCLAEVRGFDSSRHLDYRAKFQTHFGAHINHPAVAEARRLARERMIHFGSPVSFALHLDGSYRLLATAKPAPSVFISNAGALADAGGTMDFRWSREVGESFATLLRDFAEKSQFEAFMHEHRKFHQIAADRLTQLASRLDLAWSHQARAGSFRLITSPLLGPGNFGPTLPGGGHAAVLGMWKFDSTGAPVFDDRAFEVLVHEYLHPLVNPGVDKHMNLLRPVGMALAKARKADFARTGYAAEVFNPDLLYETLVRALEVLYLEDHGGPDQAKVKLEREVKRGWTWLPQVLPWIRKAHSSGKFVKAEADTFRELAEILMACATPGEAEQSHLPVTN